MIPKDNFQKIIFLGLLVFLGLIILKPIDLATADLGRHLKNGELILSGDFRVLSQNLYSYTFPDYPFINHHWLSGVIFYLVFWIAGFGGLHAFFIFLSLITFWLFFDTEVKESSFYTGSVLALLLIPVIGYRTEIRPEVFSYFFCGFFIWLLTKHAKENGIEKRLYLLPFLMILWVNLHIYFFLGFFLIGIFWLEKYIQKIFIKKSLFSFDKDLSLVLGLTVLASLINPFGYKLFLHPFEIYGNYGYRVLEEQSVFFLQKLIVLPAIAYFELGFGILVLSWFFALFKFKKTTALSSGFISSAIFSVVFSVLGWEMVRNFSLFGLFVLPLASFNLRDLPSYISKQSKYLILPILGVALIFVLVLNSSYFEARNYGVGLSQGEDGGAKFFISANLTGPVFNNYDIGGYLIYYLYPKERVFTDNRPEVYPSGFFQNIYIPAQQDQKKWQELDSKYHFNAIFFYRRDATDWGQQFLVSRIKDPAWAPVFVDNYTIIFLKRTELNRKLISKFELPKQIFKTD